MAQKDVFFSIVIINFNYARFLPESIGSALAQDYEKFEVIVVDDASTDHSRAVIESFGDKVVTVFKQDNRGHGDGFNRGFAASGGDIVLFLDADDFLYPHALSRLRSQVAPGIAMYQWRMDLVDGLGAPVSFFPALGQELDSGNLAGVVLDRARYSSSVTSGMAFDRRTLERILPMDADAFRQGGDGYLATVAPLYGEVRVVDGILSAYRQHGANHSQFAEALATRARWRIEHDQARCRALADMADRLGLAASPSPQDKDILHLTERLVSLRLDPSAHPCPDDTRSVLFRKAMRSIRGLPISRRMFMASWWIVAAFFPITIARRAMSWRLLAASRPRWMTLAIRAAKKLLQSRASARVRTSAT